MSRFNRRPRTQHYESPQNIKNLFELIRDEKIAVEYLARNWVLLYKDNETEAYLILLTFLLESIGLDKNLITTNDLETQNMENILNKIHQKCKDSEDYPMQSRNKSFKSFYLNFQHFWIYLMTEAGDTLYDEVVLIFLANWLSSFSFSSHRSIRHTSTIALLSLGQALVDILSKELGDLERVQTFIRTEAQNSDTQRLLHLKTQEQEIISKKNILNRHLDDMFNDVIKYRCLDVLMEIRAVSLQGLNYMTEKFPSKFLSEEVIKIIGYSLYDKAHEVRLKSIEFIQSLLSEENMPKLTGFIEQHKLRLIEMSHDVENKCCVSAINLCIKLAKKFMMTKDEKNMIACLIWADNEEIRNNACNFLLQVVFKDKLPADLSANITLSLDQGKSIDDEKGIMKLVEFYKDFGETEMCRIEIVTQTLWNKTRVVKSWETMCEMLKRGDKPNTTPLPETDKKIIMYMLISGLKFICTSPDKKLKHIMISLTSTLIMQLPSLLIFYSMDFDTLKELIKIPTYFDLSALSSKDLKTPFTNLLSILIDINNKSEYPEIIFKTTQSIAKLAREPHNLQKEAKIELAKVVNDVCCSLKTTLKEFILECEEDQLGKWLLRTESLISVYDILEDISQDTFVDIMSILSQYLSNSISSSFLAGCAGGIMYYFHLWDLNKITKFPEGVSKYNTTRNEIIELYAAIVAKPDCDSELKYKIFIYLCETLMIVSSQAAFGSPLHYEVTTDIWTTIEEYILSKPLEKIRSEIPIPAKAFYKTGAKNEIGKEEANETTQTICLLVGRIISFCPSLTTSHLPSSYLAHFGTSSLKSINTIVKQVILYYKTKESQQAGVFNDNNLFFSIILESMIKSMGTGTDEEISNMKDLAKKFTSVMGSGAMRPKQADKFLSFILDGIAFAFSDKDNFQILEGLNAFLMKNYLSPTQMKELYDRVSKDADTIENKIKEYEGDISAIMYPIKHFLYNVGKVVGIARQPPVPPSEKTKKQINKKREEMYKKKDGDAFESKLQKAKNVEMESKAVKKSSYNVVEGFKNCIKKSAIVNDKEPLPSQNTSENVDNRSESIPKNPETIENIDLPKKRAIRETETTEILRSIRKSSIQITNNMVSNPSNTNSVPSRPSIKKTSISLHSLSLASLNPHKDSIPNPDLQKDSESNKASDFDKDSDFNKGSDFDKDSDDMIDYSLVPPDPIVKSIKTLSIKKY